MTSDYQKRQQDNYIRLLRLMGDPEPDTVLGFDADGHFQAVDIQATLTALGDRMTTLENKTNNLKGRIKTLEKTTHDDTGGGHLDKD